MDGSRLVLAGLQSDNLLIRLTVGGLIVFGSLYVLDSFGVPAMFGLAVLVAAGIFIAQRAQKGTR